jgi:tight adherence protein C
MSSAALWVAVLASAITAAAAAACLATPRARLARRLRPYTVPARTALGDRRELRVAGAAPRAGRWLPATPAETRAALAQRLQHALEPTDDATLEQRLRRAGLLAEFPPGQRAAAYRARVLAVTAAGTAAAAGLATLAGAGPLAALAAAGLGGVAGATRWRGRIERAVRARRERIRIELYTVNQLLALHVRAGASVTQAVARVADRVGGVLAGELREVLAAHRSGRPLDAALAHAASDTVEPNAARTYRLLASGVSYGTDLADALRRLSDDIRVERAEALRRAATRRRAAMLLPTIAILAPVMLLFVGAPLPSIVLGGLP